MGVPAAIQSWIQIGKQIDLADESIKRATATADEFTKKQKELKDALAFKLPAETAAETQVQEFANAKATIDAAKTVSAAKIAFEEQTSKQSLALGKITLAQEIAQLKDAESQKYEDAKAGIANRRALEQAKAVTGKPADTSALEAEAEAEEIRHQLRLAEITTTGQKEQTAAYVKGTQEQIAALKLKDEASEESARMEQISRGTLMNVLTADENARYALQQQELTAQRASHQQIENAEAEHNLRLAKILDDFLKKAQETDDQLAAAQEKLATSLQKMGNELAKVDVKEQDAGLKAVTKSTLDYLKANQDLQKAIASATPTGWITQTREMEAEEDKLKQKVQDLKDELAKPEDQNNLALKEQLQKAEAELTTLQGQLAKFHITWAITWKQIAVDAQDSILHIENQFNSAISGWITGQETFASAMRRVWQSLVTDIVNDILKIGEEWINEHIIMAAVAKIFGSPASNTADRSAEASSIIQDDTAQASADVFLQAIEGVPFPANLLAAPAAAAAVEAQMGAFAAQVGAGGGGGGGFFAQGGIVPHDMPAFLHRKEMVLPAALSSFVQSSAGEAAGGATDVGGRNEQHVHLHYNAGGNSFVDSTDAAGFFKKNEAHFLKTMQSAVRRGAFNPKWLL